MENTKVDLKKLKEQDWEKYKKMRKVASRQKITSGNIAVVAVVAILIGLMVGALFIFSSAVHHATTLANYSNNQTVAVLHNLNISFNRTTYAHWTNATLSTLISTMKTNPKALSTFAVSTYATMQSYFILSMFLITVLLVVFYILFLTNTNSIGISRTYKYFKRELNRLAERDENLRKYGFTESEIAWYHAVRSELIKLELEYGM